jgi:hypothetical protein
MPASSRPHQPCQLCHIYITQLSSFTTVLFFRDFIDEHFVTLRRDQVVVKYLAERYARIAWPADGNFAFMQFHWGDHYNGISPELEKLKWYGKQGKGLSENTPYYYSPFGPYAEG